MYNLNIFLGIINAMIIPMLILLLITISTATNELRVKKTLIKSNLNKTTISSSNLIKKIKTVTEIEEGLRFYYPHPKMIAPIVQNFKAVAGYLHA